MRIGEAPPIAGQAIDVRSLYLCRAVTGEIAVSQIIGKDEDDIGRCGRKELSTEDTKKREEAFDHDTVGSESCALIDE